MPDDSQGFDWSALLKSATPYAAALIPAAAGALAGGRGAAATGAATGFAEGMRGQVLSQQEYEHQRAQVQEANQRAAIEHQNTILRAQANQVAAAHAAAQIPYLEAETRKIDQQAEQYKISQKGELEYADTLQGAQKAMYLSLPPGGQAREKFQENRWLEQKQAVAMPGLVEGAMLRGMPRNTAIAYAQAPKGFDELTKYIHDIDVARERANDRRPVTPSFSEKIGNYKDENGNPVEAIFNNHTNETIFRPLPPGIKAEPKPPAPNVVQTTLDKMYLADTGKKPGVTGGEEARKEWEMSPYGELASKRANNEIAGKAYEEARSSLRKADATGMANARKDYLSAPVSDPRKYERTAEGWDKFILTPQGKEFIDAHKDLARAGQAPPPREPVARPVTLEKPAAVPKAGEVQKGYRFKGGDPSDQKNWEKVK